MRAGSTRTVTDLPDARPCPHNIRPTLSEAVDLLLQGPLVMAPKFPSCQVELNIHPQQNVPIHELNFEANLNTFKVGRDASDSVIFPYHGFQSIGERAPGFHLAIDNSPSARPDMGPSVRICWTIDFANIPTSVAAVVFSLSFSSVQALRALVLNLHSAVTDGTTYTRKDHVSHMRLSGQTIQEQSNGHQQGTIVLAVLARSDAWWHMHGMHSFSPPHTGKTFCERICQQPSVVRSYDALWDASLKPAHASQPHLCEQCHCSHPNRIYIRTVQAHARLGISFPADYAVLGCWHPTLWPHSCLQCNLHLH